mmetsp:Transcript_11613/g.20910  ORF Transcript_11613/g.20910 Transcript_11613/m.20910 type:complete len:402 (-) Transcript_11613:357-1562(-)|eukprot:CAMPEP_0175064486 /NCGR_PEP_ID=MMETSP0052_2-20121109/15361_1 /TAXON_ID=51329 ORGANISM="Polytomella parva, Strain SAG 63-3" /NCGR_SAMPLE_ID=MMETSP0052_2 /ASSEMBLY_ACC=CAM_ASM_000194 /LENGTH=401 /DNA_ID=CAMNT_0016330845 /DNA_START=24 /DNA_END=1229 /DNA_ORIENTATION=+
MNINSKGSKDCTGKSKVQEDKSSNRLRISYFIIGLCIGILISERIYVTHRTLDPISSKLLATKTEFLDNHSFKSSKDDSIILKNESLPLNSDVAPTASTVDTATAVPEPRNELEKTLRLIAPNKELLVAISNKNMLWDNMLNSFVNGIKKSGFTNYLIVALDEETRKWCIENNVNAFLISVIIPDSQKGTGDNHAVSSMKFGILKQFLELDYSVFLSDIDVCILQNPFDHIYRDSDVEGMSDGFDPPTAYGAIDGFDDPSMGWGRFAQFYKHFNMNSGLFYLRANKRTIELMTRLETRLSKEKYWDQTAYNEEIFFLSHGDYKSPQVSVRVLDIYKFMNSKVLFKDVRHRPRENRPPKPIIVHANYHPDKHQRMKAIFSFYNDNDEGPLMRLPGGSEPGSR